ncbi:MAG: hypothetical protein MJA29_14050, partial [Candidatus Omnitrophica bacterium]|nr:hypothetical protein [Candidatus Omnitrophota bacterium]
IDELENRFLSISNTVMEHHIALKLLSNGSIALIQDTNRYLDLVTQFDKKVSSFLDGLDELSTGRLCFEILDPIDLKRYLIAIQDDLDEQNTNYELVFQHVYQYYAEPMISFTNSADYILIQIPILLKYKFQLPMTLFSTDVVPIPFDLESYLGYKNEFTMINAAKGYIAISSNEYAPLSEEQLRLCWNLRGTYYCEHSYLMISKDVTTCVSAIYYNQNAELITFACQTTFTQNKYFPPKIMDTGSHLVLSNLPQPWILLCDYTQRPQAVEYSTYRILAKSELCACSLAASTEYLITKAMVDCPDDRNDYTEFKSYYAFNKIIFDTLEAAFGMFPSEYIKTRLSDLTEQIPLYNLPVLNWFTGFEDKPQTILQEDNNVIEVPLLDMLYNVYNEVEEELYRSTQEWELAQRQFFNFMKEATGWQLLQFWSGTLSIILWIFAIFLCVCHRKLIIATILSSQKLDEYNIVKTMPTPTEAFPTVPSLKTDDPDWLPILTIPPDHDKILEGIDPFRKTMILAVIVLIIVGVSFTIIFCCF